MLRSLVVLSVFSLPVFADWSLDNSRSQLFFVSTKNAHISEVHHFENLSGTIDKQGNIAVDIDLRSVNTGIEIRDTRMKEKLFNVDVVPSARIAATMPQSVSDMAPGQGALLDVDATLTIGPVSTPLKLPLYLNKTSDGLITATNAKPIILQSAQLGLTEGLSVLQKLAGLSSISQTVPVTLHVTFTPAP